MIWESGEFYKYRRLWEFIGDEPIKYNYIHVCPDPVEGVCLSATASMLSCCVGGTGRWQRSWHDAEEGSNVFQVLAGEPVPEGAAEPGCVPAEAAGGQPAHGAVRAAARHLRAQEVHPGRGAA